MSGQRQGKGIAKLSYEKFSSAKLFKHDLENYLVAIGK